MLLPVKVVFCYAREDEPLLDKLKAQLSPLQREGLITMWHDRDINAGDTWEHEIDKHLNAAGIILLLISPDFINSDYCYSVEMKKALDQRKRGESIVVPIILRPTNWYIEPLKDLQALPKDARPVTQWKNRDEALYDIAKGIRKVIEDRATNLSEEEITGESSVRLISEKAIMDWLIDEAQMTNGKVSVDLGDIPGVKHSMRLAKDNEDWEAWYGMWFQQAFVERMGFEPTEESVIYALKTYRKLANGIQQKIEQMIINPTTNLPDVQKVLYQQKQKNTLTVNAYKKAFDSLEESREQLGAKTKYLGLNQNIRVNTLFYGDNLGLRPSGG